MRDRLFLMILAASMAAALAVFVGAPRLRHEPPATPPDALDALAARVAGRPADELAMAKVLEVALDSPLESRFALWHAAHEQQVLLDPRRPEPASSFVRSGLFHWYELSEPDRRSVIDALEPLLRDPVFFDTMARSIFELTGDLSVFKRANPGTANSFGFLASLAATHGRFADYRSFDEQSRRRALAQFDSVKGQASPGELLAYVTHDPHTEDTPLLSAILNELHIRPLDDNPSRGDQLNALIDFALDHNLEPLDGLEAVTRLGDAAGDPQRARLALRVGEHERATVIEQNTHTTAGWTRYFLERAVAAAQERDAKAADRYLQRASRDGVTVEVLQASEQVARARGDEATANQMHAELVRRAGKIERWLNGCGTDVCRDARGIVWTDGSPLKMKVVTVQSDDVKPYVEVYVDDAPVAAKALDPSLDVVAPVSAGIHRVEVRIANPMTRNNFQRRVRVE